MTVVGCTEGASRDCFDDLDECYPAKSISSNRPRPQSKGMQKILNGTRQIRDEGVDVVSTWML